LSGSSSSFNKVWLPIIVIVGAVAIFVGMTMMKKAPTRAVPPDTGVLVHYVTAEPVERVVTVSGTGTVVPRWKVNIQPEITGKVEWISPKMVSGGFFRSGEPMVRIDSLDYQLAVDQAEAAVAKAQVAALVARANADIAKQQWDMVAANRERLVGLDSINLNNPNPLVLNEPQLLDAESGLKSAQATLEKARLNLKRTEITAPFNCKIGSTGIAVGQLVTPSTVIGQLYGTDGVEIEVGLPVADLEWFDVPGAKAEVVLDVGNKQYKWEGRIDRSTGVVDQAGRLSRVVVQVANPFVSRDGSPDLSIGSFVSVEIEGHKVERIYALPRRALREESTVWVSKADSTLDIRTVEVARLTPGEVLIRSGISDGEKVVLTNLLGGVAGLKLRPVVEGTAR